MLTMADKGGKGVWTPPFLADIICEQPLTGLGALDIAKCSVVLQCIEVLCSAVLCWTVQLIAI